MHPVSKPRTNSSQRSTDPVNPQGIELNVKVGTQYRRMQVHKDELTSAFAKRLKEEFGVTTASAPTFIVEGKGYHTDEAQFNASRAQGDTAQLARTMGELQISSDLTVLLAIFPKPPTD